MFWKAPARQLPLILAALVCVLGCLPRAGMEDVQETSEAFRAPALQCFEATPPVRGVLLLEGAGQLQEEDERLQALRCSSAAPATVIPIAERSGYRVLRVLESGCLITCVEPSSPSGPRDLPSSESLRAIFSPDPKEDEPDPFPLELKRVKPVPQR